MNIELIRWWNNLGLISLVAFKWMSRRQTMCLWNNCQLNRTVSYGWQWSSEKSH